MDRENVELPVAESSLRQQIPAALIALLCGGVWAVALIRTFANHIGQDQSWLLYAARAVLGGVKLNGPYLVESNTPIVVWFDFLPIGLARLLHLSVINGFRCVWLLMAALIGWWLASLFAQLYRPGALRLWCFVLVESAVGLLAINAEDLGQREHLTAMLLLPYLLFAAYRIEKKQHSRYEAIAVGIAAALAICLKPQQIILVFLVEALVLVRVRRLQEWIASPLVAMALGLVVYSVTVILFARNYLTEMVPLLKETYWGTNEHWSIILHTARRPLVVWAVGAVMYAAWRKRLQVEALAAVLLVGSSGAMLAYLQQHKGWHYQLICFTVFGALLTGLMAVEWIEMQLVMWQAGLAGWRYVRPVAVALVVFVAGVWFGSQHMKYKAYPEIRKQEMADIYAEYPRGTAVSFLSETSWDFPSIMEQDKVLGTRNLYDWLLGVIVRSEDPLGDEVKEPISPEAVAALTKTHRVAEAEDLEHWKPMVVVVDRCTLPQFCDPRQEKRFGSLVEWFQREPAFREQWLHYTLEKTVDGLDVYTRVR